MNPRRVSLVKDFFNCIYKEIDSRNCMKRCVSAKAIFDAGEEGRVLKQLPVKMVFDSRIVLIALEAQFRGGALSPRKLLSTALWRRA